MDENIGKRSSGVFGAALLVAGTCIGAGMLAMPVVTSGMGFAPSIFINFLTCLFMIATGLLFMEVTFWMKEGAHIRSMSQHFLGWFGRYVGVGSFAFLYYCLLVGYFSAASPMFMGVLHHLTGWGEAGWMGYALLSLFFVAVVGLGADVINRVNFILLVGLMGAYVGLMVTGSSDIDPQLLSRQNWGLSVVALPTLFSAYGYHNLIPSLASMTGRRVSVLRQAIILGSLMAFITYSFWQWVVLGSIPVEILDVTLAEGESVTSALWQLQAVTENLWVTRFGVFFSFFAVITSLLGVSFSMVDFCADALRVSRRGKSRWALCLLVLLPPAYFALQSPNVFLHAMGIAGGFGEAIINGLLPISMVWIGRYHFGYQRPYRLFGGRSMLILLTLITLLVICLEFAHLINL